MSHRIVAIIQARMGSSRFPGKMTARLGGHAIIEWVIRRLQRARSLDAIILATSVLPGDDVLAAEAARLGIAVHRGSESDVLGRFADAARWADADTVIRVCADNPFIDPQEIDRLVEYFSGNECDYACNHLDRLGSRYADGFGAEIFPAQLLQDMARLAVEPRHREHVTLYLWDNADSYRLKPVAAPQELAYPDLRFDVDTPDDLQYLAGLVEKGISLDSTAPGIVQVALAAGMRCQRAGLAAEIDAYLERLFPITRSITGPGNRETLRILREIVPIEIREYPSGTPVYDWVIPPEWRVRDAYIKNRRGERMVDFRANNVHLMSYSVPVAAAMDFAALRPHLHTHPELPDAVPYRTSYYRRDWGFCVTHAQLAALQAEGDGLEVVIDAEFDEAGSLTIGELLIPGESEDEILISTYICHPSLANDNLSGAVLTAFIARELLAMPRRLHSYRIIWVPETIGAIAYSAMNEAMMKRIGAGLVVTTVGGPGPFGYKQSFDPEHPINALIEEVFREAREEYITYPFDIHGSDERQYSSQGFRINVASITKDKYYHYPYYHTSLDNLDFVTGARMARSLEHYLALLRRLDRNVRYRNLHPNCEVMLSRHDLYPKTGGGQLPLIGGRSELDLILWLLFWCDGEYTLQQIAQKLDVPMIALLPVVDKLLDKGVLERVAG